MSISGDGRTSKQLGMSPQQPAIPWHDGHSCGEAPSNGRVVVEGSPDAFGRWSGGHSRRLIGRTRGHLIFRPDTGKPDSVGFVRVGVCRGKSTKSLGLGQDHLGNRLLAKPGWNTSARISEADEVSSSLSSQPTL
ncbi:hypothetical protein QTP88_022917 [Uroleucon formosanum]